MNDEIRLPPVVLADAGRVTQAADALWEQANRDGAIRDGKLVDRKAFAVLLAQRTGVSVERAEEATKNLAVGSVSGTMPAGWAHKINEALGAGRRPKPGDGPFDLLNGDLEHQANLGRIKKVLEALVPTRAHRATRFVERVALEHGVTPDVAAQRLLAKIDSGPEGVAAFEKWFREDMHLLNDAATGEETTTVTDQFIAQLARTLEEAKALRVEAQRQGEAVMLAQQSATWAAENGYGSGDVDLESFKLHQNVERLAKETNRNYADVAARLLSDDVAGSYEAWKARQAPASGFATTKHDYGEVPEQLAEWDRRAHALSAATGITYDQAITQIAGEDYE